MKRYHMETPNMVRPGEKSNKAAARISGDYAYHSDALIKYGKDRHMVSIPFFHPQLATAITSNKPLSEKITILILPHRDTTKSSIFLCMGPTRERIDSEIDDYLRHARVSEIDLGFEDVEFFKYFERNLQLMQP